MTSKIVVNNIEADSGINTITFINEVTAPTFNGNITGTAATFTTGTFSGNVDIAGALTYEDVTNVDSVGIITARDGIHVTGGSVGIEQANPQGKLHVYTDSLNANNGYNGQNFGIVVETEDGNDDGDEGNGICFTQQYSADGIDSGKVRTGAIIGFKDQATGNFGGGLKFKVQPFGASPLLTSMVLDKSGNILTSGNTQLFGSNTSDGSDNKSIMINGGGSASDTRGGYLLVHGNEHSSNPGITRLHAGNVGTAGIEMYTAGSERLRITSAGNVGIGLTNPTFGQSTPISTYNPKFGVNGSVMIGNLSTTASDRSELQFFRRNGAAGQPIDTHDMGRIAWYGSTNDSDNSNLAWSIGVNPDGGTWTSGSNRKGYMTFNNHDGEKLRITSGGSVAIGTASQMGSNYARISIDCQGRDVLTDVTDITKYGLAFHNDPNTDDANGIGFFNDDGTNCGGYILHQDKGSNNLGDLIFGTSETSNTPVERLRILADGTIRKGTANAGNSKAPVELFFQKRSTQIGKRIHQGSGSTATTHNILNIDSWQSANSHAFIYVTVYYVSPVSNYGGRMECYAHAVNSGGSVSGGQGTFVTSDAGRWGNPGVPSLSWSGSTLQFNTLAQSYIDYSLDITCIAYDGAVVSYYSN